jgi:hypothetical protein
MEDYKDNKASEKSPDNPSASGESAPDKIIKKEEKKKNKLNQESQEPFIAPVPPEIDSEKNDERKDSASDPNYQYFPQMPYPDPDKEG